MVQFSTKRQYGGLKDQDRIFTNLYKDGDPFIDGALKRVSTMIRDSEPDPSFLNVG
jgi:hypothetical protein